VIPASDVPQLRDSVNQLYTSLTFMTFQYRRRQWDYFYACMIINIVLSACGGSLRGETGSLAYPTESSQRYPSGVNCLWRIFTTPTKVRSTTFTFTFTFVLIPSLSTRRCKCVANGSHCFTLWRGARCPSPRTSPPLSDLRASGFVPSGRSFVFPFL